MDYMSILSLLGGLGLFLFGIKAMGEGLEQAAGSKMKKLLESLTRNRFLAVFMGAAITAILQSSSATTVMIVGFVNAGLITLRDAIGVIMGANIGTTVTSLMLSVELDFGMLFATIGAICLLAGNKHIFHVTGQIMMWLGVLFVGMDTMSSAMVPLREWQGFVDMMTFASNPLVGVLVGALITALLQSSSASVGILQALAGTGVISLQASMFILFGQNIGTCVTALIASVGTNRTAKRAAVVHLLFNIIGSVLFIIIALTLPLTTWVERMAGDNLRLQISFVHIIFNVTTTLALLPLSSVLEKLAFMVVRGEDKPIEPMRMQYFDTRLFSTPPIAAQQLFKEVQRMALLALDNFKFSLQYLNSTKNADKKEFINREEVIDLLNDEITQNLIELRGLHLTSDDIHLTGSLFHVVNDLERIGDHATNIVEIAESYHTNKYKFSPKAQLEYKEIFEKVGLMLEKSIDIFCNQKTDVSSIADVLNLEKDVDNLCETYANHHIDRVKDKKCTPQNGMLFLDLLNNLERIGDHADNLAISVERGDSPGKMLW